MIVKVKRRRGATKWMLLHIEIQSGHDRHFGQRIWTYYQRIFHVQRLPVVSLAVLADRSRKWRPDHYEMKTCGCRARLDFPIIKLLDFEPEIDRLLYGDNPFAFVLAAHLKTLTLRSPWRKRLDFNSTAQGVELDKLVQIL